MSILFPQVGRDDARQIIERVRSLGAKPGYHHPAQTFSPVGGRRLTEIELQTIRERAVAVFASATANLRSGTTLTSEIDRELMLLLTEVMRITPHEASKPGVWQFLSCVLLPDLVLRRFPVRDEKLTEERFMGGSRNAFRRLWWRAFILDHGHSTRVADRLMEDELVQIMERPTIAGNRLLARTLSVRFLALVEAPRSTSAQAALGVREALMRQTARRILRLGAVVALDALSEPDVVRLVDGQLQASLDVLMQGVRLDALATAA